MTDSVFASVGPNLPQDLFAAAGNYAGPLATDADRPTPRADAWLESKFAPWGRSIVEAWAAGELDGLTKVIFSRADDTAHRLYYYVCELQQRGAIGGPTPCILDIAKIPRATSVARTAHAVRALAKELGVGDAAIEAAIAATNQRRAAPSVLPDGPRCLLVGTPPPDRRLHQVIEACGFAPMGATLAEVWNDPGPMVDQGTADPCEAIARSIHADPAGSRSFADWAEPLRAEIVRVAPAAVVLWRIDEDEAQAWHLPAQRRVLAESGVPALTLTNRRWRADDGAPEEIARFLQSQAKDLPR